MNLESLLKWFPNRFVLLPFFKSASRKNCYGYRIFQMSVNSTTLSLTWPGKASAQRIRSLIAG